MRQHYYYIKLLDHNVIRCEKATDPREACRLAFGCIYSGVPTVGYKDIGTRSPKYLTLKRKQELEGPDGWLPIP
jgi:hypothetical protein